MIGHVFRISTICATTMLASSLTLAVSIGIGGTIERTTTKCRTCPGIAAAMRLEPPRPIVMAEVALHRSRGGIRIAEAIR
jgi:hypothetical protein